MVGSPVIQQQSRVACLQGDYREARQLAQESLAIAQENNSRQVSLASLRALGDATCALGEYDEARQAYQECLAQISLSGVGAVLWRALSTFSLGNIAFVLGDNEVAKDLFEDNLTLGRQLNHTWAIASAHYGLGRVAYSKGDFSEANQRLQASVNLYKETGL